MIVTVRGGPEDGKVIRDVPSGIEWIPDQDGYHLPVYWDRRVLKFVAVYAFREALTPSQK